MGVEESNGQRFRPKKIQELVAQATSSIKLSDKGLKLKGEVRKLRELARKAKTTGN